MTMLLKEDRFARLDLEKPVPLSEKLIQDQVERPEHLSAAMDIWREATDPDATLAEKYLRQRGITLARIPSCIRFHPSCYHGPSKTRQPAMVTLITTAAENLPCGIHRTYLDAQGHGKSSLEPNKMMLGRSSRAVARLSEEADVLYGVGISEGIESGLSVLSFGWAPVWATLSKIGMSEFPILVGIQSLTIFADNDQPGIDGAETCGGRWSAAGKEVFINKPAKHGLDWNDVICQTGSVNQ